MSPPAWPTPLHRLLDGLLSHDQDNIEQSFSEIRDLLSSQDVPARPNSKKRTAGKFELDESSNAETLASQLLSSMPELASLPTGRHDCLPLHVAARLGSVELCRIVHRAQPLSAVTPNRKGKLPLHFAARAGHVAVVRFLIHVAPSAASWATSKGKIPLHFGAAAGHREVCQLLLEAFPAGASGRTCKGLLPQHLASRDGHSYIAEMISASLGLQEEAIAILREGDQTSVEKIRGEAIDGLIDLSQGGEALDSSLAARNVEVRIQGHDCRRSGGIKSIGSDANIFKDIPDSTDWSKARRKWGAMPMEQAEYYEFLARDASERYRAQQEGSGTDCEGHIQRTTQKPTHESHERLSERKCRDVEFDPEQSILPARSDFKRTLIYAKDQCDGLGSVFVSHPLPLGDGGFPLERLGRGTEFQELLHDRDKLIHRLREPGNARETTHLPPPLKIVVRDNIGFPRRYYKMYAAVASAQNNRICLPPPQKVLAVDRNGALRDYYATYSAISMPADMAHQSLMAMHAAAQDVMIEGTKSHSPYSSSLTQPVTSTGV